MNTSWVTIERFHYQKKFCYKFHIIALNSEVNAIGQTIILACVGIARDRTPPSQCLCEHDSAETPQIPPHQITFNDLKTLSSIGAMINQETVLSAELGNRCWGVRLRTWYLDDFL